MYFEVQYYIIQSIYILMSVVQNDNAIVLELLYSSGI
jgi:hypothetical protein